MGGDDRRVLLETEPQKEKEVYVRVGWHTLGTEPQKEKEVYVRVGWYGE